jgi:hypothetical protein
MSKSILPLLFVCYNHNKLLVVENVGTSEMKTVESLFSVKDKDLDRAYEIAINFLQEKGYKVKKVKAGISPFAPTYEKVIIIHISPVPDEVSELVNLESELQGRVGERVGVLLS